MLPQGSSKNKLTRRAAMSSSQIRVLAALVVLLVTGAACCVLGCAGLFVLGRGPLSDVDTGKGGVLCYTFFQQLICIFMTAGTDLFSLGNGIRYLEGSVYRMAGQAVRGVKGRQGAVVLVTFSTLGDASVLFRMAG